jgi:MFS family permease
MDQYLCVFVLRNGICGFFMDAVANPAVQLVESNVELREVREGQTVGDQEKGPETTTTVAVEDVFPGDHGSAEAYWVLFGAFISLFPAFGFMVSIGTLQDYWHLHQLANYTPRDVGWIPSVFVYLALGLGICIGPLFDRFGPRWILWIGSSSYIAMVFLLAECSQYYQFLLCLGVLGGAAGACLTTTSLAVVSHWFKIRRGLAAGIAMIGSSFGGVVIPLVLRATLPKYGYQWSVRILGFVFTGCLIVGNFLMKPRLPPSPEAKKQSIFSLRLFGDPAFSFLTVSVFGVEIVLFGALGILPTYATSSTDFPPDTGFYLIAVMNGVSCFGRIIPGYISDIIGRFNVFAIAIASTLVIMLVIWLPFGHTSLAALYLFVALFGFLTGCWMAMTPACIGQLCEAEHFGRYYGTLYFVASLATLVCIPISGELVESVGPQVMVGFMCVVLAVSLGTFVASRWACLGWKWKWMAKV